jgi:hypothetical protein
LILALIGLVCFLAGAALGLYMRDLVEKLEDEIRRNLD